MNNTTDDEERILRVWTPVILRTILASAIVILLLGLLSMAWQNPGYYVEHFHRLQGHVRYQNRESMAGAPFSAWLFRVPATRASWLRPARDWPRRSRASARMSHH